MGNNGRPAIERSGAPGREAVTDDWLGAAEKWAETRAMNTDARFPVTAARNSGNEVALESVSRTFVSYLAYFCKQTAKASSHISKHALEVGTLSIYGFSQIMI